MDSDEIEGRVFYYHDRHDPDCIIREEFGNARGPADRFRTVRLLGLDGEWGAPGTTLAAAAPGARDWLPVSVDRIENIIADRERSHRA